VLRSPGNFPIAEFGPRRIDFATARPLHNSVTIDTKDDLTIEQINRTRERGRFDGLLLGFFGGVCVDIGLLDQRTRGSIPDNHPYNKCYLAQKREDVCN